MTGFTPMAFRKTRIFGTRGMLEGDGYTVSVFDFLTGTTTTTAVVDPDDPMAGAGHLGADAALTRAFLAGVRDADPSRILTSPEVSLHSHAVVWAAERARLRGTVEPVGPDRPGHRIPRPDAGPIFPSQAADAGLMG